MWLLEIVRGLIDATIIAFLVIAVSCFFAALAVIATSIFDSYCLTESVEIDWAWPLNRPR